MGINGSKYIQQRLSGQDNLESHLKRKHVAKGANTKLYHLTINHRLDFTAY